MRKPNRKQRRILNRAMAVYEEALPLAARYLTDRGIGERAAKRFHLGFVATPEVGHEGFAGRLAIPYVDRMGTYGFKFRCVDSHDCKAVDCPKYLNIPGQEPSLFNVLALESSSDTLHITEGELDTIVLSQIVDDPVIGVPGATQWQSHWPFHMAGYDRICVWPDGDKAGKDMAAAFRKHIRSLEVMTLPQGSDVSDLFNREGPSVFHQLLGVDRDEDSFAGEGV